MSDVFATGKVAMKSQFIGRKDLVDRVHKCLYKDRHNVALVGLPRIGKSSVAYQVYEKIKGNIKANNEKALILMVDLAGETTFETAWCSIIQKLYDLAADQGIHHPQLDKETLFFAEKQPSEYQIIKIHVEKFLQRLQKLDVRVFLMIDEFDAAVEKFRGERYYYEFFREIASTASYSVTLMLISRQLIKRIEANAYGNSTLFGILEPITIREFDISNDIPEYFEVLERNSCILSIEQREQMENVAGRNPYLLCIMGDKLIDAHEERPDEISIEHIYLQNRILIQNYFEALMHQMENDKNLSLIMKIVIGPRYDVTKDDVDMLCEMGYLSTNNSTKYWVVVSNEFSSYLQVEGKNKDIWKNLTETQLLLQDVVKKNLPLLLGWTEENISVEEYNKRLENENISELKNNGMYKKFIESNKRHFGVESTYIDVISIETLTSLMKKYWDNSDYGFRYIFGKKSYAAWSSDFDRLHSSRLACAHAHPEYLSSKEIDDTNLACERIKEMLKKMDF